MRKSICALLVGISILGSACATIAARRNGAPGVRTALEAQDDAEDGRRCATESPTPEQQQRVQERLEGFREALADEVQKILEVTEVNVCFHVLYTKAEGSLSDEVLDKQIAVLNEEYKKCGFVFKRAKVNRIPLEGPDAKGKPDWFEMTVDSPEEKAVKAKYHEDPDKYLNLYTAKPADKVLGWSTFPWKLKEGTAARQNDGVVILYSTLPGGSKSNYNRGKTAVHEVGHWLGLYHTFQGGCQPPGDHVDDTPYQANTPAKYRCDDTLDTCPDLPGKDPVHNFMNYTPDDCMYEFTGGQCVRIKECLGVYRYKLLQDRAKLALVSSQLEKSVALAAQARASSLRIAALEKELNAVQDHLRTVALQARAGDRGGDNVRIAGDMPGPIDNIRDLQDTAKMLFKMADTNNDGLISQKEAIDVGNLLVGGFLFRADTNGDGILEPHEALAAREQLFRQQPLLRYVFEKARPQNVGGAAPGDVRNQPPDQAARNIAANPAQAIGNLLDTNHDRKIEASELRQAVQQAVQTLFLVADTNQDGQLSPAELNRAVGEAARTAVQVAFQTADTDRNGALSMEEFDKALTGPAHVAFGVLDANNDNQLSIDELQHAQQIIANQIQRLQVPNAPNSPLRQLQGTQTGTNGIGRPGAVPATAPNPPR
jgi:Ca2+-binding EF-hand superfamily protein